jgi:transposase
MGNRYIRRLPCLGAMGVIAPRQGSRRKSDPGNDWPGRLIATKPLEVVAIAQASRMARAIRAMPGTGEAWRTA